MSMRCAEISKQKSAISLPAKLSERDDILVGTKTKAELTRSSEKPRNMIKYDGEVKLDRSKTMPIKTDLNQKSTHVRRKFTGLNPESKLYDTHKMMSLLKLSVRESSNLPPIVQKQLKRNEIDPYINKVPRTDHGALTANDTILLANLDVDLVVSNRCILPPIENDRLYSSTEDVSSTDDSQAVVSDEENYDARSNKKQLTPVMETSDYIRPRSDNSTRRMSITSHATKTSLPVSTNDDKYDEYGESTFVCDNLDNIDRPGTLILDPIWSQYELGDSIDYKIDEQIQFKNEVHIYLSSFFTDFEVECSALLIRVIPELRSYFAAFGYEFYYHDCHLGTDGYTNMHDLEDICLGTLEQATNSACLNTENGIIFISCFGQKYGDYELPYRVEKDCLEAVHAAAHVEYNVLVEAREAELAKKREAEQLKKLNKKLNAAKLKAAQAEEAGNVEGTKKGKNSILTKKREPEIEENDEKDKEVVVSLPFVEIIDPDILFRWYELDLENKHYIIKPISTNIPEINQRKDFASHQTTKNKWFKEKNIIIKIFEKYKNLMNPSNDYDSTVTAKELTQFTKVFGKYRDTTKNNQSAGKILIIERSICEIDLANTHESLLLNYFDMKPSTANSRAFDTETTDKLYKLKEKINYEMAQKYFLDYIINWDFRSGVSLQNREHASYIDRLCKQVKDLILRSWDPVLRKPERRINRRAQEAIDFDNEIKQNKILLKKSCKQFFGPHNLLSKLKSYVESSSTVPLIITGESGCGKTSLLNRFVAELNRHNKNLNIIVRCCGKTQITSNMRLFLKSLSMEIDDIYTSVENGGTVSRPVPNDLPSLKNSFVERLAKATANRPLLIIIDAIEQIKIDFDESLINWLPKELPSNVYIIMTTNLKKPKDIDLLKKHFANDDLQQVESFLKLESNTVLCSHDISNDFLRVFNESDGNYPPEVIQAFLNFLIELTDPRTTKAINPLYFRVLFKYLENILTFRTFLKSFDDKTNNKLFTLKSTKHVLEQFFFTLEAEYGEGLIRSFMGYIATYQFCGGITQNELIDLVSLDKQLTNSLNFDSSPYKCLHECLWIQIKRSLVKLDLIQEVHNIGGYRCMIFKHKIFHEIVSDRYVKSRTEQSASQFHKAVVSYYLNEHDKHGNQQAAHQPIEARSKATPLTTESKYGNLRRLHLITHHICYSNPTLELVKREILYNYQHARTKLLYTDFESLLDDIVMTMTANADLSSILMTDKELKTFLEFLHISETALKQSPTQLCSQLVNRFSVIAPIMPSGYKSRASESQTPAKGKEKYDNIKLMVYESVEHANATDDSYHPTILSNHSLSLHPEAAPTVLLRGNLTSISEFTVTYDGNKLMTFEINGMCKLWDLKKNQLIKVFYSINDIVRQARFAFGNLYLIVTTINNYVNVWNVRTCEKLFTISDENNEVPQITIAGGMQGKYLICCFGCKEISIWNLKNFTKITRIELQPLTVSKLRREQTFESSSVFSSSCNFGLKVLLTKNCSESKIAYAFRGSNHAYVVNCQTGKQVHKYTVDSRSGFVDNIEVTRDYCLVLCEVCKTRGYHQVYKIEVYDIVKGNLCRTLEGCSRDHIVDIHADLLGSTLCALSYSEKDHKFELITWTIETEEHRHLYLRGTQLAPNKILATNMKFVLTSAIGYFEQEQQQQYFKQQQQQSIQPTDDIETKQIRVWNMQDKYGAFNTNRCLNADEDGIVEIIQLRGKYTGYIVTRHTANRRLRLWDMRPVDKVNTPVKSAQVTSTAITYEPEYSPRFVSDFLSNSNDSNILIKPNDVILALDDLNVVILTDKDTTNVESEKCPIFQSIHIFNLRTDRYVSKLSNLFICAFDPNEFIILRTNVLTSANDDLILIGLSESRSHFIVYSVRTGHIIKRMKTIFKDLQHQRENAKLDHATTNQPNFNQIKLSNPNLSFNKTQTSIQRDDHYDPKMTRINETAITQSTQNSDLFYLQYLQYQNTSFVQVPTAEELDKEKLTKTIEQFVISANQKTIVTSYYAHHMCVFDLDTFTHVRTIEDPNCLLHLYVSHITYDGGHLIHPAYDCIKKIAYLNVWDIACGQIKRRIRNETNIMGVIVSDDSEFVVFCRSNGDVRVWHTSVHNSIKTIRYEPKFKFDPDSKLFLLKKNTMGLILSGKYLSVWNLVKLQLMTVFTTDFKLTSYSLVMNDSLFLCGISTLAKLISLKLPD